ncbi:hypothetical protein RHAL1_01172 [Beijerinckiaceae bacterium RH AL1]|nr:hypothetical protein RHCH11_RHCH11_01146 [Beijerinckiaceae bacterium RH CH11]VVB44364.1 hypothetical protein RHAL8_01143 [Beijerinckiaceae bacterium RH AL8]VVC54277.1 hypothetical protein RHAL1_01172 [Beijerinckiaceae bacterium RH AL1]
MTKRMVVPATTTSPWPQRGLAYTDFRKIAPNGLGDQHNAYPHSMALFDGKLFVGTSRSNLAMLRVSKMKTRIKHWPIETPASLYDLDMRAQIHSLDLATGAWREVHRSPILDPSVGRGIPREMSYRCMAVFKGRSDPKPALYCVTYASARGNGAHILRSLDGETFEPMLRPESFATGSVITVRSLVAFKGRLFTSPAGVAGGNPNAAFNAVVFESADPATEPWVAASELGFGDPGNVSVLEMAAFGDHLYAGTLNYEGFQVWRTRAEGKPPYRWECVVTRGAYRGKLNQCVFSMRVFKDALYVGGGIQHGGVDVANKTGPAGPEVIRINADGSYDLIVGLSRETASGWKTALSGFRPGFGFVTNGYFWCMTVHDGWLYLGTLNWATMMPYADHANWPGLMTRVYDRLGDRAVLDNLCGAHLYRSCDGENWLAVTRNGFDNPYNYGIRTLVSTPIGLAVGFVNPFAPMVGIVEQDAVRYEPNPRGGLEIWLGRTERDEPFPEGLPDFGGDLAASREPPTHHR